MQAFSGILLLILLLALIVFVIALSVIPTILNILVAGLLVWPLKKYTSNKVSLGAIFIILSFALAMNIRLLDVAADMWERQPYETNINKKITLKYGTKISLNSNIETISYKKNPLDTTKLGGDEGRGLYYVNPKVIQEDVRRVLTNHGLVISNDVNNDMTLDISADTDNYLAYVNMSLTHNGKLLTETKVRLRKKYYGDVDLTETGRSEDGSLWPYFTRNTLWNYLLSLSGIIPNQEKVVSQFIEDNITIESSKAIESIIKAPILNNPSLDRKFSMDYGKSGDIVWCDRGVVSKDSKFFHGLHIIDRDKIIPIEHSLMNIDKVVCQNNRIYIVSTPKHSKNYFRIHEYNYQGGNVGNYKYITPLIKNKGYPRKPLIYFQALDRSLVVGTLEFGKNIPPKYHYYRLNKEISNTQ